RGLVSTTRTWSAGAPGNPHASTRRMVPGSTGQGRLRPTPLREMLWTMQRQPSVPEAPGGHTRHRCRIGWRGAIRRSLPDSAGGVDDFGCSMRGDTAISSSQGAALQPYVAVASGSNAANVLAAERAVADDGSRTDPAFALEETTMTRRFLLAAGMVSCLAVWA